eukprot:TRINITY_DN4588_c0_g1_i1.p1 TRINITY_DN4588_c0_g1~~TRINITY_DN4588_c0_g1_i1.p1  ORF type:complete len:380 (+),score=63.11 TRINITY_DN4588_c0_g1_i1:428-1567(+)
MQLTLDGSEASSLPASQVQLFYYGNPVFHLFGIISAIGIFCSLLLIVRFTSDYFAFRARKKQNERIESGRIDGGEEYPLVNHGDEALVNVLLLLVYVSVADLLSDSGFLTGFFVNPGEYPAVCIGQSIVLGTADRLMLGLTVYLTFWISRLENANPLGIGVPYIVRVTENFVARANVTLFCLIYTVFSVGVVGYGALLGWTEYDHTTPWCGMSVEHHLWRSIVLVWGWIMVSFVLTMVYIIRSWNAGYTGFALSQLVTIVLPNTFVLVWALATDGVVPVWLWNVYMLVRPLAPILNFFVRFYVFPSETARPPMADRAVANSDGASPIDRYPHSPDSAHHSPHTISSGSDDVYGSVGRRSEFVAAGPRRVPGGGGRQSVL